MRKKSFPIRRVVQIAFFVLIALITLGNGLLKAGVQLPLVSEVSLHAICPFGGVVSIYQVVTAATFVKKVHQASFILMGIGFVLALLFGPVFCGWVCPMGTVQEWVGKLGKKLLGKRYNRIVPASVDRILRYLRYAVLAWVLVMTALTGKLAFEAYDPYWTLFNLWSSEVAWTGYAILAAVLGLSLFVERPFCKYGCPYGAVLGVFNLFRIFGVKRNPPTCTNCKACDKACPMNIVVSGKKGRVKDHAGRVRDHQCITCMECTSERACPVAETVEVKL
jgi:polyferredoxin